MLKFRFEIGSTVMCNLGPKGWKLGKVIALKYREPHWPADTFAPYQVSLEDDHMLIYVPEDDDRCCRETTEEDLRIARRMDALAALPQEFEPDSSTLEGVDLNSQLSDLEDTSAPPYYLSYRSGDCHCCGCNPREWSNVELYSEHYRCATRHNHRVTRHKVDLGVMSVGDSIKCPADGHYASKEGFSQAPTLVRLPPGVRFFDDGTLSGEILFDPSRPSSYQVNFVAVSTADWSDDQIGLVRLEISFIIEGNEPPNDFDLERFTQEQKHAQLTAHGILRDLCDAWEMWEREELSHRGTIDKMGDRLDQLRTLLEQFPRLDGGQWWVHLGGFHMNIHKLLENALFECELYLGHALTFGDAGIRRMAEQNLEGCYQKRLLEAARFMWVEGIELMRRGEWAVAAEKMRLAAAKKEGWGWAVNYGDIWISESAARLIYGASLDVEEEAEKWVTEAKRLLKRGMKRAKESGAFTVSGHPWGSEIRAALIEYRNVRGHHAALTKWLEDLKLRTDYWCAQVLGGAEPFPPQVRDRREDADKLVRRLKTLSIK